MVLFYSGSLEAVDSFFLGFGFLASAPNPSEKRPPFFFKLIGGRLS
jgi:hypothetical protein